jgi:methylglyoxal synthase
VTGGSYDLIRPWIPLKAKSGARHHPLVHRLEPSALGVIQLTNLVVFGFCRAVLFFNDPEDYYADSPQNLCLRRICNEYNVPLLEDLTSIEFMLKKRWFVDSRKVPTWAPEPPGLADELNRYLDGDERLYGPDFASSDRTDRTLETLAVVSHNEKKIHMLAFCVEHMEKILQYRRILTTGTTGQRLREHYRAALANPALRKRIRSLRSIGCQPNESVDALLARKIQPFRSGPAGGDIQISAKIIDGTCHRVIFFQDPQTAHPHQFDIRLMEKATQDLETGALYATSEHMARLIV